MLSTIALIKTCDLRSMDMNNSRYNPYFIAKKLDFLNLANDITWLGETTYKSAEIKGKWVARKLYQLDHGYIGFERIFYEHDSNKGKTYPKRPTYIQGYTGDKTPAFTPIGCPFNKLKDQHDFIIVGGYADAITLYNAWFSSGTLTNPPVILAIQGENNTPKLVKQLKGLVPNARIVAALDGDNGGRQGIRAAGVEWVTPDNGDWNDLYLSQGLNVVLDQYLLINKPIPSFTLEKLFNLKRPSFDKKLLLKFSKLTNYEDIAATALTLCIALKKDIPTKWKDESALLHYLLAHNFKLAQGTIDALKGLVRKSMRDIQLTALSLNTLGKEHKNQHEYKKIKTLDDIPELGNGVHLLSAGHGVGKTEKVGIPFINSEINKALTLCHLRSLTADMATRFNIAHYEDYTKGIKEYCRCNGVSVEKALQHDNRNAVAICLNSIILTLEEWVKQTNTILIDEVSQVLNVLATGEYKNFNNLDAYNRLCEVIKNAGRVLVMDADLDDTVISFLEKCRPNERFNIYEMPRKSTDYKIEWVYGTLNKISPTATAEERLLALMANDKKVIVATDSKRKASGLGKLVQAQFPNKKILVINADTTTRKDVKDFLKEPNQHAPLYDVVIHSPSMRSGVSITVNHFDMGMGVFSGTSITPQDAIQMLRRARNISEWLVCVDSSNIDGMTDVNEMKKAQEFLDLLDNKDKFLPDELTNFDYFRNEQVAKENKGKSIFAQALYYQLLAYKFKIIHCENRANEVSVLSVINKQDKEHYTSLLMNAPRLTESEYEELRSQEALELEDKAMIEAYCIRDFLNISSIDEEHIQLWDEGRCRQSLLLFKALSSNTEINDITKNMPLSMRSFINVKVKFVREIIDMSGIDITTDSISGEITQQQQNTILGYMWKNRTLLAYLKMISAKYANPKAQQFTDAKKQIKPLLEKVGIHLSTKRKRNSDSSKADNRERSLVIAENKMKLICTINKGRNVPVSSIHIKDICGSGTVEIPIIEIALPHMIKQSLWQSIENIYVSNPYYDLN